MLIPRIDEKEVASVFTAPLEKFLKVRYGEDEGGIDPEKRDGVEWYTGSWVPWNGHKWK